MSPSVRGGPFSIRESALSYQARACGRSPLCRKAMARQGQSPLSPPFLSSIDFVRASVAAVPWPVR